MLCLTNFTKPISKNGVFHNENIITKVFKLFVLPLCIYEASSH